MNSEILYEKFLKSGQESKKLEIALEEILHQKDLKSDAKEVYISYLKRRYRSAKILLKEIESSEFIWNSHIKKDELCGNIRWNLSRKYPYFSSAFSALNEKKTSENLFGSDGKYFYYPEKIDEINCKNNLPNMCRIYIHTVLHCYFGHMFFGENKDEKLWNLACDIYVESVLKENFSQVFSLNLEERVMENILGEQVRKEEKEQEKIIRKLKEIVHPFRPENLYQYLKNQEEIREWIPLFTRDSHEFWKKNNYNYCMGNDAISYTKKAEEKSQNRFMLAEKWNKIRKQVQSEKGQAAGKRGSTAGGLSYQIVLDKKKKYDYKRFLERFTFPGEEMMLDLESFDYIPYMYSRSHYEKLVFLEPLEYAEVHKLKELIIAIDTSGSCRGKIVKQFLEETYEILSRKENFFKRMKVYIIQCDSMIQDCVCIENQEQWKEYVEHLKVRGLGGTDFRPVFELVEKLRERKELSNPGGLIYFTDGDGIYPKKATDYETAFVFLNDAFKKGNAPSWAIELNLQIALEDEELGDKL